ncbi:hypothetical protein HanIR_Chr07g0319791 [Helianthus annuus]|nr:hypothetical protein HanIR_Chr07g0319791 [Helianthus annuus]
MKATYYSGDDGVRFLSTIKNRRMLMVDGRDENYRYKEFGKLNKVMMKLHLDVFKKKFKDNAKSLVNMYTKSVESKYSFVCLSCIYILAIFSFSKLSKLT